MKIPLNELIWIFGQSGNVQRSLGILRENQWQWSICFGSIPCYQSLEFFCMRHEGESLYIMNFTDMNTMLQSTFCSGRFNRRRWLCCPDRMDSNHNNSNSHVSQPSGPSNTINSEKPMEKDVFVNHRMCTFFYFSCSSENWYITSCNFDITVS